MSLNSFDDSDFPMIEPHTPFSYKIGKPVAYLNLSKPTGPTINEFHSSDAPLTPLLISKPTLTGSLFAQYNAGISYKNNLKDKGSTAAAPPQI